MVARREKTISYRRAEWFADVSGITLEGLIRDALTSLKTIDLRTINHGGQFFRIAKNEEGPYSGLNLHITADTPGEHISVVPKAKPGAAAMDLKTEKPPRDGEWLDGDAFLYVRKDHLCMCATGLRDGAIEYYIHQLFLKAKLRKDAIRFQLMKAADITKLKLLHTQGVKELEIKATLYKATAEYERRKTQTVGTIGAIGKHLKRLAKKPNDVTPDGLRVTLIFKADKRFSNDFRIGEKEIEAMAADVVKNTEKMTSS